MILIILIVLLAGLALILANSAGWAFAAKRISGIVVIIVLVTFLTTVLLRQVPGDACITALGTGASEEAVAECREDRRLDDNVVEQYGAWANDVLIESDLGPAQYRTQIPLTRVLKDRAPRSGWLFLYSQVIAIGIAIPIGVWSAYQAGRKPRALPGWGVWAIVALLFVLSATFGMALSASIFLAVLVPIFVYHGIRGGPAADNTVNTFAFILLSIPVFVLAETLRYVFAIERDWYDLTGYAPWGEGVGAHLGSIWLPALVLGLATSPVYLRLLRADMVQNLQQDFVAVAKAKGMSNRHILFRHVLRPSTVTLLTVVGLNIGQLVNGAIVVEFIYDFDGMGSYLLEAVAAREFFPVQTLVAIVAVLFVLVNTLVDVVYTVVDPRVSVEDDK
ncbi:MAG: ABC transporter permease [Actinomycetota bacterium]